MSDIEKYCTNGEYVEGTVFFTDGGTKWDSERIEHNLRSAARNNEDIRKVDTEIAVEHDINKLKQKEELNEYSIWILPDEYIKKDSVWREVEKIIAGWSDLHHLTRILILESDLSSDSDFEGRKSKLEDILGPRPLVASEWDDLVGKVRGHMLTMDPSTPRGKNNVRDFNGEDV